MSSMSIQSGGYSDRETFGAAVVTKTLETMNGVSSSSAKLPWKVSIGMAVRTLMFRSPSWGRRMRERGPLWTLTCRCLPVFIR